MTASMAGEQAIAGERRTSPIELLWDLVFVFAVTQVSALLSRDLAWPRLADPRPPARAAGGRRRALRRALWPVHHHLPGRVCGGDRRGGERPSARRGDRRRRWPRHPHHGRPVVDVLRALRLAGRGEPA